GTAGRADRGTGLADPVVERGAGLRRRRHAGALPQRLSAAAGGKRAGPRPWTGRGGRTARAAQMTGEQVKVDVIRVSRDENPVAEARREWLVTNGLGGFASATISGEIVLRNNRFLLA